MKQLLQILHFFEDVLWPDVIITIILGFLAAIITVLIKIRLERGQINLPLPKLNGVVTQDFPDEERSKIIEEETEQLLINSIVKFQNSPNANSRLSAFQYIAQMAKGIDDKILEDLARKGLSDEDERLRGEVCYALSMSGKPRFIQLIQEQLNDPSSWVREQAEKALKQLEQIVDGESNKIFA